ncbi:MAG: MoaD/ThiS family protein [Bacillota bacterium]|nr:MoaD/ThiS family protein [Bacillota bacterium]
MILIIKMMPPYCKKGTPDEREFELAGTSVSLREMVVRLNREWQDVLDYPLVDSLGQPTAEFTINGNSTSPDQLLKDGDKVTIIPYICGG